MDEPLSEQHLPLDSEAVIQHAPVCRGCGEPLDDDEEPLYQATCGHEECASSVWHGPCLMADREMMAQRRKFEHAAAKAADAAVEAVRRQLAGEEPDET